MGRETHAPWIEIEVNGARSKAILDTGAEFHVVQAWFAEKAGIQQNTERRADVSDSAKKSMKASIGEVRGTLATWGPLETPAVIIPTLPMFQDAGIGMIVNPTLLTDPGRVLRMDFVAREMSELKALSKPPASGVGTQACATLSRLKDGAVITTTRHLTEVKMGEITIALTIDTGARTTVVAANAEATSALLPRATGTETAGGVFGTEEVKTVPDAVTLTVGGAELAVTGIRLSPAEPERTSCKDEGVLGMDVLAQCVLELSLTDSRLSCSPSAGAR